MPSGGCATNGQAVGVLPRDNGNVAGIGGDRCTAHEGTPLAKFYCPRAIFGANPGIGDAMSCRQVPSDGAPETYNDNGIPDHPKTINLYTRADCQLRDTGFEVENHDRIVPLHRERCQHTVRGKFQDGSSVR